MEFWAVEVKGREPFKVELQAKRALHLSQACIGEVEKDSSESICLFVNVNGKKLVLGTLNTEKLPQQTFDLVFDKTFELSHNWKKGSVFFHGYTADNDNSDDLSDNSSDSKSFEESSSSDEDIPVIAPNGGPASEVKQEDSKVNAGKNSAAGKLKVTIVKSKNDASSEDSDDSSDDDATSSEDDPKVKSGKDSAAGKQKVKMVEPKKDTSSEDDSSDDDDDDATSSEDDPKASSGKDSAAAAGNQNAKIVLPKNDANSEDDADSSEDEDAMSEDDSEDNVDNKSASDEDSDNDEDEVTPVQVKSSKKRASVSASKKHVPEKKAKLITPEKTDGKKSSVHVDTPYPSKQAGKNPANKPNQLTPNTEGSHPCKSCKKKFKSELGLESHTKAKHSGGK